MRYLVCWFLAPETEAAAVRSIALEGPAAREKWPHLVVPHVDGFDVNKLEKIARPKRGKGTTRLGGILLDRSKMTAEPFTSVCRVSPEFVAALAVFDERKIEESGRAWSEAIENVAEETAIRLVTSMAQFARSAQTSGLPVLEPQRDVVGLRSRADPDRQPIGTRRVDPVVPRAKI